MCVIPSVQILSNNIDQIFPLDENVIFGFIKSLIGEWRSVGRALDLPSHVLEEIAANNPHNVRGCMMTIISQWMNASSTDPPSWWILTKALRSLQQNGVVQKISSDYGKKYYA